MRKWIFLVANLFITNVVFADYFILSPTKPILSYQPYFGKALEKIEGIQVVQTGDHIKVILGADSFFRPNTSQIFPSKSNALTQVADLVRSYGRGRIIITGHTDNVGTDAEKMKKSFDQANTISAYFWSVGIPLRRMTIIGCGDTYPVATNQLPNSSVANRRVEIETQNY